MIEFGRKYQNTDQCCLITSAGKSFLRTKHKSVINSKQWHKYPKTFKAIMTKEGEGGD